MPSTAYNSPVIGYPGISAAGGLPFIGGRILPRDAGKVCPTSQITDQPISARVVPWPFSADTAGCAFPSGLLGLIFTAQSLDESISPSLWQQSLIAVPSGLPSGFMQNNGNGTWRGGGAPTSGQLPTTVAALLGWGGLARSGAYQPWLRGQSQYSYSGGGSIAVNGYNDPQSGTPGFPRILVNGGLYDHPLGPMNVGQSIQGTVYNENEAIIDPTSIYPGMDTVPIGWQPILNGCRSVLVQCSLNCSTLAVPSLTQCNLVIYRKSDWSTGGVTPPGIQVSSTALSFSGTTFGTAVATATLPAISPPHGTLGNVWVQLECMGNGAGYVITIPVAGCSATFCSRVDIPFPWTVASVYQGSTYVATGGYDPTILANPNLRTPATLTGTMTSFDPTITGDDAYVIVQAYLSNGFHTISTSDSGWAFGGGIAGPGGFYNSLNAFSTSQGFTAPTAGVYAFAVATFSGAIHLQVV